MLNLQEIRPLRIHVLWFFLLRQKRKPIHVVISDNKTKWNNMSFGYTHENGTKMRSLAYEGRWCLAVVLLSKVTRLEDWNKKQEKSD